MTQFTPLFDEITERYGIVTSAVFGYVWRKCQMEKGVCCASFQTIADDLNVSRKTIINHIKILANDGLVEDLTPDADRKPHKYLVKEIPQTRESNTLDDKVTRESLTPGGESNSLALGNLIPQTRESLTPKDTDTLRNKEYIYMHPLPDEVQELITAITQTVKTGYAPKTEDDFEATAVMLLGWEVTPEKVLGFSEWWRENGYYPGRPALKSMMNEFRNYLDGVSMSENGRSQNGQVHHTLKNHEIKQVKGEF